MIMIMIPSGKLTVCYGKSPFGIGKSTVNEPFSIVMKQITRGMFNTNVVMIFTMSIPLGELFVGLLFNHTMGMYGSRILMFHKVSRPQIQVGLVSLIRMQYDLGMIWVSSAPQIFTG